MAMRVLVRRLVLLAVCVQIGGCAVTSLSSGGWGAVGGGGGVFGAGNTGTGGTLGSVPPFGIPFDTAGGP